MTLRAKRLGVSDLLMLGLVFAFACVHAGRAATLPATGPTLQAVLLKAAAGDVVTLPPGPAGDVYLKAVNPAALVTIRAADSANPPSLNTLTVNTSSNLAFEGLSVDYTPTALTYAFSPIVKIDTSSNISLKGGHIYGGLAVNGIDPSGTTLDKFGTVKGFGAGYGVNIVASKQVRITGVEIKWATQGIVFNGAADVLIEDNWIHEMRKTPIVGPIGPNVVINHNRLGESKPWRYGETPIGDHGDIMRLWTVAGLAQPYEGLRVTNNTATQMDGLPLVGLALEGSSAAGPGFLAPVFEGNSLTLSSGPQGIIPTGSKGGSIKGNTLLGVTLDVKKAPGILLTADVTGMTVSGNVAGFVVDTSKLNTIAADNTIFTGLYSAFKVPAPPPTVDPRDAQIATLTAANADLTAKLKAANDNLATANATVSTLQAQAVTADMALKTAQDGQKATQASLDGAQAALAVKNAALAAIQSQAATAQAAH